MPTTITPKLHAEIWEDLQARAGPQAPRVRKISTKQKPLENPNKTLWRIINTGGAVNIDRLQKLLDGGLEPQPTHIHRALDSRISMSDTRIIVEMLLPKVVFPLDEKPRHKIVDKFYRTLIAIKGNNGVDPDFVAITQKLFQAGLFPSDKYWDNLVFGDDTDVNTEFTYWFMRQALWQYPKLPIIF